MSLREFLDGQVTVYPLPQQADSFGRFRGGDDRGEVAMFVAEDKIEHIEYAEFREAHVRRGDHFHKNYVEKLYVIRGALLLSVSDMRDQESVTVKLRAGDVVMIQPGIAHGFYALEPSMALSAGYGDKPFVDRYPYAGLVFDMGLAQK